MNKNGKLIAVVGPSGVGKDSIIAGVLAAMPEIKSVKRIITRKPDLGGEDYRSASEMEFAQAVANGDYCLHWRAHNLSYGISKDVLTSVNNGQNHIANLSRSVLADANAVFLETLFIHVTATAETLAQRLAQRGREGKNAITARLARSNYPMPQGVDVHQVSNDGNLQEAIDEVVMLIGNTTTVT